ncbi:MAG: hypothetical protein PHT52_03105 [Eubacteriales bacterium]|jgi:hypothetical protein|nr:hypothetical protein [Eubacteriales bacterium]HBI55861.1 hypothetical protein [Bacillota bacterium]HBS93984.1 hypothetical protein [Bacillota bacterium]HCX78570.1 hypothetical protein [Bacillota bacterium]
MNDERMQILEMIAQGKITPAQGAELLEALEKDAPRVQQPQGKPRWLRIRVFEGNNSADRINLRVPVEWAEKLLKFGSRFANAQIDRDEIDQAIEAGELGQILEVDNEGDRVEIWLEG